MKLLVSLAFIGIGVICERNSSPVKTPAPHKPPAIDFKTSVQPILEQRCSPCHFPGGVMHARLPFDNASTISHLGTKLFGRIKDEESRRIIRAFLKSRD